MGYTNEELRHMSAEELKKITYLDMDENPPIRNIGIPYTVVYSCKYCHADLEGSERTVSNMKKSKDVRCPYCNGILWDHNGKSILRKSAFPLGHFDKERKKRYLCYLRKRVK